MNTMSTPPTLTVGDVTANIGALMDLPRGSRITDAHGEAFVRDDRGFVPAQKTSPSEFSTNDAPFCVTALGLHRRDLVGAARGTLIRQIADREYFVLGTVIRKIADGECFVLEPHPGFSGQIHWFNIDTLEPGLPRDDGWEIIAVPDGSARDKA